MLLLVKLVVVDRLLGEPLRLLKVDDGGGVLDAVPPDVGERRDGTVDRRHLVAERGVDRVDALDIALGVVRQIVQTWNFNAKEIVLRIRADLLQNISL